MISIEDERLDRLVGTLDRWFLVFVILFFAIDAVIAWPYSGSFLGWLFQVFIVAVVIFPVTAFSGTVARRTLSASTVKLAATLSNLTAVVPVKLRPLISIVVPAGPRSGVKLTSCGVRSDPLVSSATTVKSVALTAVPVGLRTLTRPLTARSGTTARICSSESSLTTVADTPPNRISV